MTIKEAFLRSCQEISRLYDEREAESVVKIIFEDIFGIKQIHSAAEFSQNHFDRLTEMKQRLLNGEPVQYILGKADFFGYQFTVNPHVLIPRAETEEMVSWILKTLTSNDTPQQVLDIGTGSGCISITLKLKSPGLKVYAIDISAEAVMTARANAEKLGADVTFETDDIFDPDISSKLGKYKTIISNPPYIPYQERTSMASRVVDYEPELALFIPTADPLYFVKRIAIVSMRHLEENGYLFLELHPGYAVCCKEMLQTAGFRHVEIRKDMSGKDRMIRATK